MDLAISVDGRLLAAYCGSGIIALVDRATGELRSALDLGGRAYGELALSEDDRTLFALRGYELQAWDIDTATMLARFDADLPLRSLATAARTQLWSAPTSAPSSRSD